MSIFNRKPKEKRQAYWEQLLKGGKGYSGKKATKETALNYSPVFACVSLASETVSTLPLGVYKKDKDGNRQVQDRHPLHKVLHDQANPAMSAKTFREIMQWNCELRGVALAQKIRNGVKQVVELNPINPDLVEEYYLDQKTRKLFFKMKNGTVYSQDEIFYFFGPGSNGIHPKSRIDLASESLGVGMAAEEFGGRFFGQGTNMGGFLKHPNPKGLSKEAFERLKTEINQNYSGLEKSNKLIILEEGMDFQAVGISNENAQFLQTRRFQVEEVCRWFGMKPHMIADLSHATFSNIEHQGIEAVRYCWRPRCVTWEQAINNQLLDKGLYAEHNLDGLMRGDLPSQAQAWHSLLQDGVLNANEVRKLMNLNPQEGDQGEIYFMPLNMIDKSTAPAEPEPQNDPEPASLPEPKSARAIPSPGELRAEQRKSVDRRRNISAAYAKKYKTASEKIVSADIQNIRNKMAEKTSEGFLGYLGADYVTDTAEVVQANTAPLITTFAAELKSILDDETGVDIDRAQYEKFTADYINTFSNRYATRSMSQIKKIVKENEEYQDLVNERLDEWADTRAEKIATEESVRQRSAFAKGAYAAAGITKLRWVAHGKSCPFCNQLDGQIVGITESFAQKGQQLAADGKEPLTFSSNLGHAPAHAGCDCDIVAEV